MRGFAQPVTKTLSGSGNDTTYIHTQTQLENIMGDHGTYTKVGTLYTFDTAVFSDSSMTTVAVRMLAQTVGVTPPSSTWART